MGTADNYELNNYLQNVIKDREGWKVVRGKIHATLRKDNLVIEIVDMPYSGEFVAGQLQGYILLKLSGSGKIFSESKVYLDLEELFRENEK